MRNSLTKAVLPDWVWNLPTVYEKLQDELSMKKGSLAEEIWQDAHDPEVHPEIVRPATVRISDELCDQEKAFLRKRKQYTAKALAKYLDLDEDEVDEADVPIIGICGSGGGLRALVAGASSYHSAQQAGLFDCVTYTAGVSGSCWLQTLYYSSITGQRFDRLLNHLKARLGIHITYPPAFLDLVTSAPTNKYLLSGGFEKWKGQDGAEFGLVDIYGLLLGARLLVPKNEVAINELDFKLSNQARFIETGAHPLPLYTAVRHEVPQPAAPSDGKDEKTKDVADDTKPQAWFQWFEFTPYELFCEELGAGIPTWGIGRTFNAGKSQWRDSGLALPEPRTPLLLGIWGSAFCATLHHFYNEAKPLLNGLTGFHLVDAQVSQRADDLVKVHPIPPAQIPNYLLGLHHLLPTHCPPSLHTTSTLALMDAGMSNNLPIYPLLRSGRNIDILVAFDASADVRKDNWLRKADDYAAQRGIAGWPAGSGWPDEANAPAAALADAAQDDADPPPGSTDLGPCTIFVGSTSTAANAQRGGRGRGPRGATTPAEEIAAHDAGLVVVYFPLLPHADVPGVDPRSSEYLSTWNFVYTPEQIEGVVALARRNFAEGAEATREAVRGVYERKRRARLARFGG